MKKITALTISVLLILSMCLNVYSNNEVTEIDNTVTNIDNTEESDTIKLEETEGIDNVISSTDSKISTDNSSSANEEETTEIKPEENSKSVENDTTASAEGVLKPA